MIGQKEQQVCRQFMQSDCVTGVVLSGECEWNNVHCAVRVITVDVKHFKGMK